MSEAADRFIAWRRSRGLPISVSEIVAKHKIAASEAPMPTHHGHGNLGKKRRPRTEEEKAHLRQASTNAWARRRYQPPEEFQEMYDEFVHRFGHKEAERLVRDHIAAVARRKHHAALQSR
jgi:hypothetical protein